MKAKIIKFLFIITCFFFILSHNILSYQFNHEVHEIQKGLKLLGYKINKVDRKFGEKTLKAIRKFQKDSNLSITGKINYETCNKINKVLSLQKQNNRAISVTSINDGKTLHKKYYRSINYALIIGINQYSNHPNLNTAVSDAKAIAHILEKKYFFEKKNIILLTNHQATKKEIVQKFEELIRLRVKKDDNVFIYYAGHGWYDEIFQIGYWVTTEATKDKTTFLQNDTVYKAIAALDRKLVRHIFLVSDSCFSGSFLKKYRDIEINITDKYFHDYYSKPSRIILTSGGNEPVSDMGKGGHSIFAYYFILQLRNNTFPYISAKQLGYEVEKMVTRNSDQKPICKYLHGVGDEDGQFFFISNNNLYTTGDDEIRSYARNRISYMKNFSLDIVFVMDMTRNMQPVISSTVGIIRYLNEEAIKLRNKGKIRVGLVGYRDRVMNQHKMGFIFRQFSSLNENIEEVIDRLTHVHEARISSEDYPEAMFDGLKFAIENNQWTENGLKIIFLVGDASGHEPGSPKNPENLSLEQIVSIAAARSIKICPFKMITAGNIERHRQQLKFLAKGTDFQTTQGTYYYEFDGRTRFGIDKFIKDAKELIKKEINNFQDLIKTRTTQ